MDLAAIASDMADRMLDAGVAVSATWTRKAGGSPATVRVVVRELADAQAQAHGQESRIRLADVWLLRGELADPQRGDALAIAGGPHAGTWTQIGVGRVDGIGTLVRCRWSDRERTVAASSRQVLR